MNEVIPFDFEGAAVRVIEEDSGPWFVAVDLGAALGLVNPRKAVADLDADEKGVTTSDTLGGRQTFLTVNESGLYHLIFKSRKPAAKRFRKWVTSEVIPAIRKTGKYAVSDQETDDLLQLDVCRMTMREFLEQKGRLNPEHMKLFAKEVRELNLAEGIVPTHEQRVHIGAIRTFCVYSLEFAWWVFRKKFSCSPNLYLIDEEEDVA